MVVSSPEDLANGIISLALSVKEKDQQISVSGTPQQGGGIFQIAKDGNCSSEVQPKNHNVNLSSYKNITQDLTLIMIVCTRTKKKKLIIS